MRYPSRLTGNVPSNDYQMSQTYPRIGRRDRGIEAPEILRRRDPQTEANDMYIVGVFVTVVGCMFVALGAAQVIADIVLSFQSRGAVAKKGFAADDLNAVAAIITAIGKLPSFAIMVVIGVILLAIGERLMAGL